MSTQTEGSKLVAPLKADLWGLWLFYGRIHSTAWRKGIGARSLWPYIYRSRSRPATVALSSTSKEVQLCWWALQKAFANKAQKLNNQAYGMGITQFLSPLWAFLSILLSFYHLCSTLRLRLLSKEERGHQWPREEQQDYAAASDVYIDFQRSCLKPHQGQVQGGKRNGFLSSRRKRTWSIQNVVLIDQVQRLIGKVVLLKHREKIRTVEGVERQKGS